MITSRLFRKCTTAVIELCLTKIDPYEGKAIPVTGRENP
jgi:hypothetical protein